MHAHFVDCEASIHVPSINLLLRVRICGACVTELGNLERVEVSVLVRCLVVGEEARLISDREAGVHCCTDGLGEGEHELGVEIGHFVSKLFGLLGLGKRRELDVNDWALVGVAFFGVADGVVHVLLATR